MIFDIEMLKKHYSSFAGNVDRAKKTLGRPLNSCRKNTIRSFIRPKNIEGI